MFNKTSQIDTLDRCQLCSIHLDTGGGCVSKLECVVSDQVA